MFFHNVFDNLSLMGSVVMIDAYHMVCYLMILISATTLVVFSRCN